MFLCKKNSKIKTTKAHLISIILCSNANQNVLVLPCSRAQGLKKNCIKYVSNQVGNDLIIKSQLNTLSRFNEYEVNDDF